MTHVKDYIDARIQNAKDSIPDLKVELAKLIDDSKAEFIEKGKIVITDAALNKKLYTFFAQSYKQKTEQELVDWLKDFGWELFYLNTDPQDENSPRNYSLYPTAEYRK